MCWRIAILWERAVAIRQKRQWSTVANEMIATFDKTWPSSLCSREEAALCAVKIESDPLRYRFTALAKKSVRVGTLGAKALAVIAKTQLYAPPEGAPLWNYFRPTENVILNKGALAQKDTRIRASKSARRREAKLTRAPEQTASAEVTECMQTSPVTSNTLRSGGSARPSTTPTTGVGQQAAPPGLERGGKGGRGRGGALQIDTKVVVLDMIVEDGIPARDVPKALVDAYVLILQRVPREEELFTQFKIKDWICELYAGDMIQQLNRFWKCRVDYCPSVQLHIFHDGTRRTDRVVGHHGELMQLVASYFHPRLGRATWLVLSFCFIVGGSAAHLNDFVCNFTPKLSAVMRDHWGKFLSGWKLLGIITEVSLGVFFARLVTELITGTHAVGGKAEMVAVFDGKTKPLAIKLEAIVRGDGGAALC